jgi:digalactosyldiacylglycerol synthase
MKYYNSKTGKTFPVDIYGQGPHSEEIKAAAVKSNIPATFFGGKDHSLLSEYKVFINPSVSEVLCTTIVEALAMGKWVVCAKVIFFWFTYIISMS